MNQQEFNARRAKGDLPKPTTIVDQSLLDSDDDSSTQEASKQTSVKMSLVPKMVAGTKTEIVKSNQAMSPQSSKNIKPQALESNLAKMQNAVSSLDVGEEAMDYGNEDGLQFLKKKSNYSEEQTAKQMLSNSSEKNKGSAIVKQEEQKKVRPKTVGRHTESGSNSGENREITKLMTDGGGETEALGPVAEESKDEPKSEYYAMSRNKLISNAKTTLSLVHKRAKAIPEAPIEQEEQKVDSFSGKHSMEGTQIESNNMISMQENIDADDDQIQEPQPQPQPPADEDYPENQEQLLQVLRDHADAENQITINHNGKQIQVNLSVLIQAKLEDEINKASAQAAKKDDDHEEENFEELPNSEIAEDEIQQLNSPGLKREPSNNENAEKAKKFAENRATNKISSQSINIPNFQVENENKDLLADSSSDEDSIIVKVNSGSLQSIIDKKVVPARPKPIAPQVSRGSADKSQVSKEEQDDKTQDDKHSLPKHPSQEDQPSQVVRSAILPPASAFNNFRKSGAEADILRRIAKDAPVEEQKNLFGSDDDDSDEAQGATLVFDELRKSQNSNRTSSLSQDKLKNSLGSQKKISIQLASNSSVNEEAVSIPIMAEKSQSQNPKMAEPIMNKLPSMTNSQKDVKSSLEQTDKKDQASTFTRNTKSSKVLENFDNGPKKNLIDDSSSEDEEVNKVQEETKSDTKLTDILKSSLPTTHSKRSEEVERLNSGGTDNSFQILGLNQYPSHDLDEKSQRLLALDKQKTLSMIHTQKIDVIQEEVTSGKSGSKQSKLENAYDLVDDLDAEVPQPMSKAFSVMAGTMQTGSNKYQDNLVVASNRSKFLGIPGFEAIAELKEELKKSDSFASSMMTANFAFTNSKSGVSQSQQSTQFQPSSAGLSSNHGKQKLDQTQIQIMPENLNNMQIIAQQRMVINQMQEYFQKQMAKDGNFNRGIIEPMMQKSFGEDDQQAPEMNKKGSLKNIVDKFEDEDEDDIGTGGFYMQTLGPAMGGLQRSRLERGGTSMVIETPRQVSLTGSVIKPNREGQEGYHHSNSMTEDNQTMDIAFKAQMAKANQRQLKDMLHDKCNELYQAEQKIEEMRKYMINSGLIKQDQTVEDIYSQAINVNRTFNNKIHFTFMFSSPRYLELEGIPLERPPIEYTDEWNGLEKVLIEQKVKLQYQRIPATKSNIKKTMEQGTCCLHLSAHGESEAIMKDILQKNYRPTFKYDKKGDQLLLETDEGMSQLLSREELKELTEQVESQENKTEDLRVVVIGSCHSEKPAWTLQQVGISHIVCIKEECTIYNDTMNVFTKEFYTRLFAQKKSICKAFYEARQVVSESVHQHIANEYTKLLLIRQDDKMPTPKDVNKNANKQEKLAFYKKVNSPENEYKCDCHPIGEFDPGQASNFQQAPLFTIPKPTKKIHERTAELHKIHDAINKKSFVTVMGIQGMGKYTLALKLAFEFQERLRFRDGVIQIDTRNQEKKSLASLLLEKFRSTHKFYEQIRMAKLSLREKHKKIKEEKNRNYSRSQSRYDFDSHSKLSSKSGIVEKAEEEDLHCLIEIMRNKSLLILVNTDEKVRPDKRFISNCESILATCKNVQFLTTCRLFPSDVENILGTDEEVITLKKLEDIQTIKMFFELAENFNPDFKDKVNDQFETLAETDPMVQRQIMAAGKGFISMKYDNKLKYAKDHFIFQKFMGGNPMTIKIFASRLKNSSLKELINQLKRDLESTISMMKRRADLAPVYMSLQSGLDQLSHLHPVTLPLYILITFMPGGLDEVEFNGGKKNPNQGIIRYCTKSNEYYGQLLNDQKEQTYNCDQLQQCDFVEIMKLIESRCLVCKVEQEENEFKAIKKSDDDENYRYMFQTMKLYSQSDILQELKQFLSFALICHYRQICIEIYKNVGMDHAQNDHDLYEYQLNKQYRKNILACFGRLQHGQYDKRGFSPKGASVPRLNGKSNVFNRENRKADFESICDDFEQTQEEMSEFGDFETGSLNDDPLLSLGGGTFNRSMRRNTMKSRDRFTTAQLRDHIRDQNSRSNSKTNAAIFDVDDDDQTYQEPVSFSNPEFKRQQTTQNTSNANESSTYNRKYSLLLDDFQEAMDDDDKEVEQEVDNEPGHWLYQKSVEDNDKSSLVVDVANLDDNSQKTSIIGEYDLQKSHVEPPQLIKRRSKSLGVKDELVDSKNLKVKASMKVMGDIDEGKLDKLSSLSSKPSNNIKSHRDNVSPFSFKQGSELGDKKSKLPTLKNYSKIITVEDSKSNSSSKNAKKSKVDDKSNNSRNSKIVANKSNYSKGSKIPKISERKDDHLSASFKLETYEEKRKTIAIEKQTSKPTSNRELKAQKYKMLKGFTGDYAWYEKRDIEKINDQGKYQAKTEKYVLMFPEECDLMYYYSCDLILLKRNVCAADILENHALKYKPVVKPPIFVEPYLSDMLKVFQANIYKLLAVTNFYHQEDEINMISDVNKHIMAAQNSFLKQGVVHGLAVTKFARAHFITNKLDKFVEHSYQIDNECENAEQRKIDFIKQASTDAEHARNLYNSIAHDYGEAQTLRLKLKLIQMKVQLGIKHNHNLEEIKVKVNDLEGKARKRVENSSSRFLLRTDSFLALTSEISFFKVKSERAIIDIMKKEELRVKATKPKKLQRISDIVQKSDKESPRESNALNASPSNKQAPMLGNVKYMRPRSSVMMKRPVFSIENEDGVYFKLELEVSYIIDATKMQKNPYEWSASVKIKDSKLSKNISKFIQTVVFNVEDRQLTQGKRKRAFSVRQYPFEHKDFTSKSFTLPIIVKWDKSLGSAYQKSDIEQELRQLVIQDVIIDIQVKGPQSCKYELLFNRKLVANQLGKQEWEKLPDQIKNYRLNDLSNSTLSKNQISDLKEHISLQICEKEPAGQIKELVHQRSNSFEEATKSPMNNKGNFSKRKSSHEFVSPQQLLNEEDSKEKSEESQESELDIAQPPQPIVLAPTQSSSELDKQLKEEQDRKLKEKNFESFRNNVNLGQFLVQPDVEKANLISDDSDENEDEFESELEEETMKVDNSARNSMLDAHKQITADTHLNTLKMGSKQNSEEFTNKTGSFTQDPQDATITPPRRSRLNDLTESTNEKVKVNTSFSDITDVRSDLSYKSNEEIKVEQYDEDDEFGGTVLSPSLVANITEGKLASDIIDALEPPLSEVNKERVSSKSSKQSTSNADVSLRMNQDEVKCAKGHPMLLVNPHRAGDRICDKCNNVIVDGDEYHQCTNCDIDYCRKCTSLGLSKEPSVETNLNFDNLQYLNLHLESQRSKSVVADDELGAMIISPTIKRNHSGLDNMIEQISDKNSSANKKRSDKVSSQSQQSSINKKSLKKYSKNKQKINEELFEQIREKTRSNSMGLSSVSIGEGSNFHIGRKLGDEDSFESHFEQLAEQTRIILAEEELEVQLSNKSTLQNKQSSGITSISSSTSSRRAFEKDKNYDQNRHDLLKSTLDLALQDFSEGEKSSQKSLLQDDNVLFLIARTTAQDTISELQKLFDNKNTGFMHTSLVKWALKGFFDEEEWTQITEEAALKGFSRQKKHISIAKLKKATDKIIQTKKLESELEGQMHNINSIPRNVSAFSFGPKKLSSDMIEEAEPDEQKNVFKMKKKNTFGKSKLAKKQFTDEQCQPSSFDTKIFGNPQPLNVNSMKKIQKDEHFYDGIDTRTQRRFEVSLSQPISQQANQLSDADQWESLVQNKEVHYFEIGNQCEIQANNRKKIKFYIRLSEIYQKEDKKVLGDFVEQITIKIGKKKYDKELGENDKEVHQRVVITDQFPPVAYTTIIFKKELNLRNFEFDYETSFNQKDQNITKEIDFNEYRDENGWVQKEKGAYKQYGNDQLSKIYMNPQDMPPQEMLPEPLVIASKEKEQKDDEGQTHLQILPRQKMTKDQKNLLMGIYQMYKKEQDPSERRILKDNMVRFLDTEGIKYNQVVKKKDKKETGVGMKRSDSQTTNYSTSTQESELDVQKGQRIFNVKLPEEETKTELSEAKKRLQRQKQLQNQQRWRMQNARQKKIVKKLLEEKNIFEQIEEGDEDEDCSSSGSSDGDNFGKGDMAKVANNIDKSIEKNRKMFQKQKSLLSMSNASLKSDGSKGSAGKKNNSPGNTKSMMKRKSTKGKGSYKKAYLQKQDSAHIYSSSDGEEEMKMPEFVKRVSKSASRSPVRERKSQIPVMRPSKSTNVSSFLTQSSLKKTQPPIQKKKTFMGKMKHMTASVMNRFMGPKPKEVEEETKSPIISPTKTQQDWKQVSAQKNQVYLKPPPRDPNAVKNRFAALVTDDSSKSGSENTSNSNEKHTLTEEITKALDAGNKQFLKGVKKHARWIQMDKICFKEKVILQMIQGDILEEPTDGIVSPCNLFMTMRGGLNGQIVLKGGVEIEAQAKAIVQKKSSRNLRMGECVVTGPGSLPVQCILHVASPMWKLYQDKPRKGLETLQECVRNSLEMARVHKLKTVSFPPISSGNNEGPPDLVARIILREIFEFVRAEKKKLPDLKNIKIINIDKSFHRIWQKQIQRSFKEAEGYQDVQLDYEKALATKRLETSSSDDSMNGEDLEIPQLDD